MGVTKQANEGSSDVEKTSDFSVRILSGAVVWNLLGNDPSGNTFGLVGSGSGSFGNGSGSVNVSGMEKSLGNGGDPTKFTLKSVNIGDFMGETENDYLILSNPTDTPVSYEMVSSDGFSLPSDDIIASSQQGDVRKNLRLSQNRSKTMGILKYSLFNR